MKDNALFRNDGEEKYVYFMSIPIMRPGVPKENIIAGNGWGYPVCFRRSKRQFVRLCSFIRKKSGELGLNMLEKILEV